MLSYLIAGFAFGVFGFAIIKYGRREANTQAVVIGLALCVFPYFVSHPVYTWVIGFSLLYAFYIVK